MIRTIFVVSDLHCGCRYGLYPADSKIKLQGDVSYLPSKGQKQLYACWKDFWYNWVPKVSKGEPYAVVVNGDAIDGFHHQNTTHLTADQNDQVNIAYELLGPIRDGAEKMYLIKGTEAHVGKAAENERNLADKLGIESSWDLWLEMHNKLIHFSHHIGTTQSTFYSSTAPLKELVEMYNTAGQWKGRPPDVVIRSHRHQCVEVRVPTETGYGVSATTGCWQLKTPYSYRLLSGRSGALHIGGHAVRYGSEDAIFTRFKIYPFRREGIVKL